MIGRVLLYTKRIEGMVAFYTTHFGFTRVDREGDRLTELRHPEGGPPLLLHAAAKGQKEGQVLVKLVVDETDVAVRREALLAAGITVGPLLDGGGYHFANLKDPSGNALQISSRFLRAD